MTLNETINYNTNTETAICLYSPPIHRCTCCNSEKHYRPTCEIDKEYRRQDFVSNNRKRARGHTCSICQGQDFVRKPNTCSICSYGDHNKNSCWFVDNNDTIPGNVNDMTYNLPEIVKLMKLRETKDKKPILEQIRNEKTLTGKCILSREYLSPQSTDLQTICKKDLCIGDALDSTSGDGHKNGINYEIKASIHASKSKINFVQIRPDHKINYYILIAYNMYENDTMGNAHIFKIPSRIVHELIVRFGGYAHGTCTVLGKITSDNIKGRNCEYALRYDPNAKKR